MAARAKNRKHVKKSLKSYLLLKPWANAIQTSQKCCLDGSLPIYVKFFRSYKQMAARAKNRKKNKMPTHPLPLGRFHSKFIGMLLR